MRIYFLSLVIVFVTTTVQFAQNGAIGFDDIISEKMLDGDAPGFSAIITKEGKTIYKHAVGKANIELGIDLNSEHVFRIGSITKQFTSSAILRLEEQGKLSIQDDIKKYIPDYPTVGEKITIEHLLTHASGIKSYTGMPSFREDYMREDLSPIEMIEVFKNEPMDFKPGEEFRYNNSGYFLLGYIIEKVTDKSYAEYIEDEFFKPLGMMDSYYGGHRQLVKNRVDGYVGEEGRYTNADFLSMTLPYAAGSLLSTPSDLAKWNQAVMNGTVLTDESKLKAHTSYTLNNGESTGYGYGWVLNDLRGSKTIGHGGGIDGFLTSSMYLPDEDVFVAVFANCMCIDPQQIAIELAAMAIGKPIITPDAIAVEAEWVDRYTGHYELRPGLIIQVIEENNKIMAKPTAQSPVELIPTALHEFFIKEIDSKLKFNVEENSDVNSMTLYQGGEHIGTRLNTKPHLDESVLQQYVGEYSSSSGDVYSFRIDDGVLYGKAMGQEVQLTPLDKHIFLSESESIKVAFSTDENENINTVSIFMGQEIKAIKTNQ